MTSVDWSKPYIVDDPYNLPVRDQGGKSNCTSHAFAYMIERRLSNHFKERTIIDIDDLWQKQLKYGTATEQGDSIKGPFIIATNYGVKFKTDSGISGKIFLTVQKEQLGQITGYVGWDIRTD